LDYSETFVVIHALHGSGNTNGLMTGDEALRDVKEQIGSWKVPLLRAGSLEDHPPA